MTIWRVRRLSMESAAVYKRQDESHHRCLRRSINPRRSRLSPPLSTCILHHHLPRTMSYVVGSFASFLSITTEACDVYYAHSSVRQCYIYIVSCSQDFVTNVRAKKTAVLTFVSESNSATVNVHLRRLLTKGTRYISLLTCVTSA